MTINQVKVLWFGIGAVVGGLVGFLGTKKYFEKEIDSCFDRFAEEASGIIENDPRDDLTYRRHLKRYTEYAKNHPEKGPIDVAYEVDHNDIPYIINADCFASDGLQNDKLTITYYAGDDTLVDDGEEIIVDRDMLIGSGNLEHFGDQSMDPDVVYIRNEQLGVDYEIIRVYQDYKVVIGGEEETKPKKKRERRTKDDSNRKKGSID